MELWWQFLLICEFVEKLVFVGVYGVVDGVVGIVRIKMIVIIIDSLWGGGDVFVFVGFFVNVYSEVYVVYQVSCMLVGGVNLKVEFIFFVDLGVMFIEYFVLFLVIIRVDLQFIIL